MGKAVILALTASFCTATSSVCQRLGVRDTPAPEGSALKFALALLRRPIWLIGVMGMILGFLFQLTALHYGGLALVQPILATELLFVFGYMALLGSHRVRRRDWLAGAAMAAGLGTFLFAAGPSGGHLHAKAALWWMAGAAALGAVALVAASAHVTFRTHTVPSRSRRTALLGAATGISWGFVAAVIKELSSRLSDGAGAIVTNWSLYVVIGAGAASMILATYALRSGPLAASQPGFTIVDPLVASLLGVFIFREHLQFGLGDLVAEAFALAVLVAGVVTLSHSQLVVGESAGETLPAPPRPLSQRASAQSRQGGPQ